MNRVGLALYAGAVHTTGAVKDFVYIEPMRLSASASKSVAGSNSARRANLAIPDTIRVEPGVCEFHGVSAQLFTTGQWW